MLDIKGGKSPRNYRRLTKDIVYYDELDGFDHDIGGEGSSLTLGDKRVETSSFPKSVRGSTPRIKGESIIEGCVEESDIVFKRHLPCPHCDTMQALKWSNIEWIDDDPSTAKYACDGCGTLIDYSEYPDMDAKGVWKDDEGNYIDEDDFLRDENHQIIDFPLHVSFFIWSAYSYFTTWSRIASEFLKAKKKSLTGDNTKLKTFVNTMLAETWEEIGETVEDDLLYARREKYAAEVPAGACVLTMAVDVQDDRLELEVVGWGEGYESWGIDNRVLRGDPSQHQVWDDLDDVLGMTFEHESGAMLPIASTTIDSGGHNTQMVYDYCKAKQKQHKRVYPIKGVGGAGRPIVSAPSKKGSGKSKRKVDLYTVGVDDAKTLTFNRLKQKEVGAGYCHFPLKYDEEYFKQLTAEKIVTKFKRGFAYKEWVKTRARNEALDLRVYSLAAIILLNPVFSALANRLVAEQKNANQLDTETDKPKKKNKRGRGARKRGSFAHGWKK